MLDIEELVQVEIDDALEYLNNYHIELYPVIDHVVLYELCYAKVIDNLTAQAEARSDENKLKEYDG